MTPGDFKVPTADAVKPAVHPVHPAGPVAPARPVVVSPVPATTVPAAVTMPPGVSSAAAPGSVAPKIRSFAQSLGAGRHEDKWSRSPNATGSGAIHVKSFHCKLTGDSLEFLDQQINEWLDAHPQYEVKFVSSAIGEWTGKLKEPNLIVMVWV